MANLYGVANPVVNLGWYNTIGAANINCPAGVETNVFQTTPITALDRGVYYPFVSATLVISCGATQPTSLTIGMRINNGADLGNQQYAIPASAANTNLTYSFMCVGLPMPTAFWPPGSTLQVSVNATGFAVTVPANYSFSILGIFRAADQ